MHNKKLKRDMKLKEEEQKKVKAQEKKAKYKVSVTAVDDRTEVTSLPPDKKNVDDLENNLYLGGKDSFSKI